MIIDAAERKRLSRAAHHLKPVVMMGNKGYTAAVVLAIDEALHDHELIKVRLRGVERERRQGVVDDLCRDLDAAFVALTGTVVTLYRPRPDEAAAGKSQ